jgi:hypothetical protein
MAIQTVKIHPAIGIARLGNSAESFIGPELPGDHTPPAGGYKDVQCRLKRQAARFRLFGYDQNGVVVQEITAADAQITWTVHLANTKAAASLFVGAFDPNQNPGLRNSGVTNRSTIVIDAGARSLSGNNQTATFDGGQFMGVPVPLGQMNTDANGRLDVLGGSGTAASPTNTALNPGVPPNSFANHDGWYDDVSDGPVTASVTLNGTTTAVAALGAWVICAPPKYAPGIYDIITLYDVLYQLAVDKGWLSPPVTPSFNNDIFPVLDRAIKIKWLFDFTMLAGGVDHTSLSGVLPPPGTQAARQTIANMHRNPSLQPTQASTSADMPKIWSDAFNPGGAFETNAALTKTQFASLQQWAAGTFVNDWTGSPPPPDTQITAAGLDRAALENCVGAGFYPGIETSWFTRDKYAFVEPFRLDITQRQPGDLTKQLSVPWQADFWDCTYDTATNGEVLLWWPAHRPDSVWPEAGGAQVDWTRGIATTAEEFITSFHRLGLVVDIGSQFLETERTVVCKSCSLIVDKSTFGQDEVEVGLPGTSSFAHAYWVAVDGYTAGELGFLQPSDLNSANPTPAPTVTATIDPALNPSLSAAQLTAITGMFVAPGGVALFAPPVVAEDPTLQQTFQRFLYPFTIAFNGDAGFVALLTNQTALVTLHASITAGNITRTASAVIELTKGEDPYFQDVNVNTPTQPSWLSFDLRFLKVKGNESRFGAPAMSTNAADAPTFISNVLGQLNTPGANLAGDSFEGLTQNEDASALEFLQKDSGGNFTFNFALARVRMIGKTAGATAKAVRVFFRLFQAQTTGSDFNDQTTYRFASDGITYGHKIARLGVQNDQNGQPEYVTVPCFATPRINLAGPASMDGQLDQPNVRDITVQTSGVEVDTYFGCWLDINQPQQTFLPLSPPAGNWDGAWTGALHSLNEVITRSPHQCLIAEIRFDDTPVPLGATSWDSDKIAQRNIAWIDGPNPGVDASRRMPHPFELRPSPTATETPDELMILWGRTPAGSTGSFYLPEVSAAEILKLADSMYAAHQLTASDANTITVPAAGLTFIPLPSGTARSAGLLTVDLAGGLKRGQVFEIVVRQLTEAAANVQPNPPPPTILARRARATVAPREGDRFTWRQLKGAFQLTITVKTKEQLLYPEERLLAWLRWIALSMPPQHRWYPVFHRYLEQIAGRVLGFGGDPTQIRPSPTGDVTPIPLPPPPKQPPSEEELAFTGKVSGLIFDHFGDFEGFLLGTEDGERRYVSREKDVETIAQRAWRERLRLRVWSERRAPERPISIIVLPPPAPFRH